MATFTVNGQTVTVEKNQKLLRYLRDELRLTSRQGRMQRGCLRHLHRSDRRQAHSGPAFQQTDKLEGKSVVTVEGLSGL